MTNNLRLLRSFDRPLELSVLQLAAKKRVDTLDKAGPRGCGGRRALGHELGIGEGHGEGGPTPPLHGHSAGQQRPRGASEASTAPLEVHHAAASRRAPQPLSRDRTGSLEKGGELGQMNLALFGRLLP
eukprot:scaffold76134_cov62-Phaeocystis_antarctica.AAC.7